MAEPLPQVDVYRTISYSQASKPCGYQLRFHREHAPQGPANAALLVGRAVHAGIQHHLVHGDVTDVDPAQQAVEVAHQELDAQLELEDTKAGVRWDDPHRLTKAGEVYRSDYGRIPSYEYALRVVGMEVLAWISRFPTLRATAVERKVRVEIGNDWRDTGYLDAELTDGGVLDVKTAADPWDVQGKEAGKLEQAQLYQYGALLEDGEPPPYFVYHVIPHTGLSLHVQMAEDAPPDILPVEYDPDAIQVIPVEYDEAAVTRVIEHRLAPVIRSIETGSYVPNTSGWWHSERFCDYWGICPLGAAARAGAGLDP